MFDHRPKEKNPRVLLRVDKNRINRVQPEFKTVTLEGDLCRISPRTPKEVFYLQALSVGYDTFPPADGDGIIIKANRLPLLKEKDERPKSYRR